MLTPSLHLNKTWLEHVFIDFKELSNHKFLETFNKFLKREHKLFYEQRK